VKHVEDSRRVVEQLLKEGSPIAVDMEGINTGVTGLIPDSGCPWKLLILSASKKPSLIPRGRPCQAA